MNENWIKLKKKYGEKREPVIVTLTLKNLLGQRGPESLNKLK